MMDVVIKPIVLVLAVILGLLIMYMMVRLVSYAILRSIEDIKAIRREKKHGSKTDNGIGS